MLNQIFKDRFKTAIKNDIERVFFKPLYFVTSSNSIINRLKGVYVSSLSFIISNLQMQKDVHKQTKNSNCNNA